MGSQSCTTFRRGDVHGVLEGGFELSREVKGPLSLYSFANGQPVELSITPEFIETLENAESTAMTYGSWIETPYYRFKIDKGASFPQFIENPSSGASSFQFQSYDAVANWGMETMITEANDKQQSSLLTLKMAGNLKPQLADYLNASIEALQAYELRQKNLMAINTIQFIDGQIIQIEGKLRDSESALEIFRSNNLIVDLSSESEQMLEYFIELEQERAALNLQRSFYKYVMEFLQNKQNFSGLSLPTLSSFNDPLVAQLTEQLVESSVSLERYRYSLDGSNPAVIELEKEVRYTKQALFNATQNALSSSNLVVEDLNKRLAEAQSKISRLPAIEQQLINIKRQYELSGGQYELLLEKRAEAGILQASNLPDTQIIDPAVRSRSETYRSKPLIKLHHWPTFRVDSSSRVHFVVAGTQY